MARYGPRPRPAAERFWHHVVPGPREGCWEWRGAREVNGYGYLMRTRTPRRWVKAHRLSWEIHRGPIPDGANVLHTCDNRLCVNPDHLWIGSNAENSQDRHAKGRDGNFKGERNPNHTLTGADVRAVVALLKTRRSQQAIGVMLGVSQQTVSRIATRRSWSHLWEE